MAELRIVGGDVALDLVNTVEPRLPGRVPERDHLGSPAALLDWAGRVELVDPRTREQVAAAWARDPASAAAALQDVLQLREALGAAVDAARGTGTGTGTDHALQAVLQRAATALRRTTLVIDPEGPHPVQRSVGTRASTLVADRLAVAALDLLQTADLHRLKSCPPERGGCGWVFLDSSRNGSRRWCSMEDCGTQVKSRRLTQRRRDHRASTRPTPA